MNRINRFLDGIEEAARDMAFMALLRFYALLSWLFGFSPDQE